MWLCSALVYSLKLMLHVLSDWWSSRGRAVVNGCVVRLVVGQVVVMQCNSCGSTSVGLMLIVDGMGSQTPAVQCISCFMVVQCSMWSCCVHDVLCSILVLQCISSLATAAVDGLCVVRLAVESWSHSAAWGPLLLCLYDAFCTSMVVQRIIMFRSNCSRWCVCVCVCVVRLAVDRTLILQCSM